MNSTEFHLLDALLNENEETRKKAKEQILRLGDEVLPFLIHATRNKDSNLRWWAVDLLGSLQNKNAVSAVLERALFDEDVHVRWRSIWAITRLKDDTVIQILLKVIIGSEEISKWNAAIILSVFSRVEACPILLSGLKSRNEFQRWEAVNALGTVYDDETIPALIAVLEQDTNDVRKEVVLSLGRIGGQKVIDPLLKALKEDHDPEVRWRAAMALKWVGNKDIIPTLDKLMQVEVVENVKKSISDAIKNLEII